MRATIQVYNAVTGYHTMLEVQSQGFRYVVVFSIIFIMLEQKIGMQNIVLLLINGIELDIGC